jgi:hypothetical protein
MSLKISSLSRLPPTVFSAPDTATSSSLVDVGAMWGVPSYPPSAFGDHHRKPNTFNDMRIVQLNQPGPRRPYEWVPR